MPDLAGSRQMLVCFKSRKKGIIMQNNMRLFLEKAFLYDKIIPQLIEAFIFLLKPDTLIS